MTTDLPGVGDPALDLRFPRLVDHHCHGLVLDDLDRTAFESLMNEASAPSSLGTSFFDSMLGLAVRRHCAPLLGLPAGVGPDDYLERRRVLGGTEVASRFLGAAGIETYLVDTGLRGRRLCTPADLPLLAGGGRARQVVRLETLAEDLIAEGVAPDAFAAAVARRLVDAVPVAAKSIAAYRMGLDLPADKPSPDALAAAVGAAAAAAGPGTVRLADPVLHGWLAHTALELGLPLQVHVGYGDTDADLTACDPLRLTPFLRATRDHGVPIVLLHNYPFHRHAAYLAQVWDHVFVDLGLATHNVGGFAQHLLRETLELAPFGKLMFSTDAYGLAELSYLGSVLFQQAMRRVLGALVRDGDADVDDATSIAALVSRDNARRAYVLS